MSTHLIVALCTVPLAISAVITLSLCILNARLSRQEERLYQHVPGHDISHVADSVCVCAVCISTSEALYG